jgi:hypothetical protein
MRVTRLALAILLGAGGVAVPAMAVALTLGELQASPRHPPPYVFRLPILAAPHGSLDTPAVTIRRPQDALSFVKGNTLELQLRALTDVELEVSHGGQTLNRLLTKHELQGARASLGAAMTWEHYQTAKAKGLPSSRLSALLDTAYQSHQAWNRVDPAAARDPLAQVAQERLRLLAASPGLSDPISQKASLQGDQSPAEQAPDTGPDDAIQRTLLEREMALLRGEIHRLMTQVTPWPATDVSPWPLHGDKATALVPLLLGGMLIAGLISFFTGYMMQRWVADYARRRRLFAAAVGLERVAPASGTTRLGTGQVASLLAQRPVPQQRAAVVKRLHVSHKIKRRVHFHPGHAPQGSPPPQAAGPAAAAAPLALPGASAPAELNEALGNLRQALLRLRRLLPPPSNSERAASRLGRGAR